jgi:hypothetical protein
MQRSNSTYGVFLIHKFSYTYNLKTHKLCGTYNTKIMLYAKSTMASIAQILTYVQHKMSVVFTTQHLCFV